MNRSHSTHKSFIQLVNAVCINRLKMCTPGLKTMDMYIAPFFVHFME